MNHSTVQFCLIRYYNLNKLCYLKFRELEVPGTWELEIPGTWKLRNLGTSELEVPGTWELWNFGSSELGNFGTWELTCGCPLIRLLLTIKPACGESLDEGSDVNLFFFL